MSSCKDEKIERERERERERVLLSCMDVSLGWGIMEDLRTPLKLHFDEVCLRLLVILTQ